MMRLSREPLYHPGDYIVALGEDFEGGMFASIDTDGYLQVASATDESIIGFFENNTAYYTTRNGAIYIDPNTGDTHIKCSIVPIGNFRAILSAGTPPNMEANVVDDAPFDTTLTYTPGDLVYCDADGYITNACIDTSSPLASRVYGVVRDADNTTGSERLEVEFYGCWSNHN